MCFSPQADLVGGVVIGAIGVDALRHVQQRIQWPRAALPVVLAAHQLIETFVWWGLQGNVPHLLGRIALYVYLAVAFGVVPVLVPIAVEALEPSWRRGRLAVFVGMGGVVAILLLYAVVRGPVGATIERHHIAYTVVLRHGGLLVAAYVLVTCGSLLLSTQPAVRWFGLANLGGVVLLAWMTERGFISLWCAWAAVTSAGIALLLRYGNTQVMVPAT